MMGLWIQSCSTGNSGLFEDVRAVKLRSSYQPLILGAAGNSVRNDILDFADMPQRHRHRYLFDVLNRTGGRVRPVRACDHSGCGQDERPTPTVPGPTELV
jgi:hypothetical protein